MRERIGILTGGGDCPGLNTVIRAVVKCASKRGWDTIGFLGGFEGLLEPLLYRPLDYKEMDALLFVGGTVLGTSNKGRFAAKTGHGDRNRIPRDILDQAKANFQQLGLRALVVVGGDGSLSIANRFFEKGIPVVGVPKTIDNDLSATDVTFGFDSALNVATEAVDRVHTTAESHNRVMIVETMGRYAGWIALRAGIAGGGDIILLPEIPYRAEDIVAAVLERKRRGKKFSIIVAAEGARPAKGKMTVTRVVEGSPDPLRLGGVSYKIAEILDRSGIGLESRVVVLGHVQRGGEPTPFDRWLASGFGVTAAGLLREITRPPMFEIGQSLQALEESNRMKS